MGKNDAHVFLEEIKIKPQAVAFNIVDDFSGENLTNLKVSIKGKDINPVKNMSGYYVFFKLPAGTYNYIVEAENFEKIDKQITVRDNDVSVDAVKYADKIVPVNLIPLPSYPFPNGTTLLRGEVMVEKDDPIEKAEVTLALANNKTRKVKTTKDGEFVIYFSRLKATCIKTVLISIKKPDSTVTVKKFFVKSDNDDDVLEPAFSKTGYMYRDNKMLLVKDDNSRDIIESFSLEIGNEVRIKKYLKKTGA
jgi:hypothetical protein